MLSILLPEEITPLKGAKRELFFLKKGAKREPESQKKGVPWHISINNFIIIIIIYYIIYYQGGHTNWMMKFQYIPVHFPVQIYLSSTALFQNSSTLSNKSNSGATKFQYNPVHFQTIILSSCLKKIGIIIKTGIIIIFLDSILLQSNTRDNRRKYLTAKLIRLDVFCFHHG